MTGISSMDRIVGLGDGVLDLKLIQPQSRARNGEVAFAGGHGRLVRHHLHGGDGLQVKLLLVIRKGLLRKGQRALLELLVLVCVHQVPVNVLHLRNGCDHLFLKGEVVDLEVLLRNVNVALVARKSETRQQIAGRQ